MLVLPEFQLVLLYRKLPVAEILVLLGGDEKNPRKSFSTKDEAIAEQTASENTEAAEEVLETSVENPRKITPPSKNCSRKIIPTSKNCSRKTRRQKGEGSGAIFYRTVTRNGRDYQQAYYHWRENGKQRSKYIPKKLLNRVQEAESDKLTVANILEILQGGLQKCSSKKFDSFSDEKLLTNNQSAKTLAKCSSKITSPPCTKNLTRPKRQQGYGAGYIECRKVKRGSKLYSQFWYHYEIWKDGDRVVKKSRYIPKRLVPKVERMNQEKVSVRKILEVLGVKE